MEIGAREASSLRWKLLRQALLPHHTGESSEDEKSAITTKLVSRKSKHGFNLLKCRSSSFHDDSGSSSSQNDARDVTLCYTLPIDSSPEIYLTQRARDVAELSDLEYCNQHDIDNTGIVCQWPSEDVLAYFCLTHADMFRSKSVIELGAGYGLAGLAIAAGTEASQVVISDGNPQVVNYIERNIEANSLAFGGTQQATAFSDTILDFLVGILRMVSENGVADGVQTLLISDHRDNLIEQLTETQKLMDTITDDLLWEILIRLCNSRQAVRCAAVCKRWSSLISAPQFAKSFSARRQGLDDADFSAAIVPLVVTRPHPFYYRAPFVDNKYYRILGETQAIRSGNYLSFLPRKDVVVWAYCRDLLLVSWLNDERLSFCVCNPITKNYWCGIPEPPVFTLGDFKCAFTCRLGNRGNYNYHVTLFITSYYPTMLMTIDFSSEIGEWSSLTKVQLPIKLDQVFWTGLINEPLTCGDGLVYWLEGKYPKWEYVVEFDPLAAPSSDGHRHTRLIHRPPAKAGERTDMHCACLGTYRGRLRVANVTYSSVLRVWELSRASSCWSLVHESALRGFSPCTALYPLALHSGDRNVIFLVSKDGCIFRYDMSSHQYYMDKLQQDMRLVSLYPLYSTWPTSVRLHERPEIEYTL